jgi:hypothetical protein
MAMQRVPLGLVGPSAKAHSPVQQSGRTVNLYPEVNTPDAKAPVALRAVPGQFRWRDFSDTDANGFADLASRKIRGCHTMGERAFWVVGNRLVEVYVENSFVVLATLNTSAGYVGMSDNAGKLILGDGVGYYAYDFDAATLSPILSEGEPIRGYQPIYLDGTTIYPLRDESRYAYSAVGDPTTVEGLWYTSAEADPDPILTGFAVAGDLYFLGSNSVEWHYNSGNADDPFQRVAGGRIEYGCVGKRAACEADNAVFMVGRNKDGAGQVYRLGGPGSVPQRISNQAVEEAIAKVLFSYDDIADRITMLSYQEAGHTFVQINLPAAEETANNPEAASQTWVYDVALPPDFGWHERGYMNPDTGRFERSLADCHIFWKGKHYTGAYNAPHVYQQSLDFYRENTLPLVKLRETAGPLSLGGRRFKVLKLGVEMETGVGRDAGVQGSEPVIILQYSWDGGRTWSDEVFRDVGAIGAGKVKVWFGPCGSGYDFTARLIFSEPCRFTLTGGWVDVDVGR